MRSRPGRDPSQILPPLRISNCARHRYGVVNTRQPGSPVPCGALTHWCHARYGPVPIVRRPLLRRLIRQPALVDLAALACPPCRDDAGTVFPPRQRPCQGIRQYHGIAVAADSVVTANGDVAARSMGSRGRSRRRCAGVVREPDGATISAGMAARSSHRGRRRRPRATVGVIRRPGQQERRGRAEVAGDDGLLFGDRSVELLADRDQRLGVSSGGRTGCRPGTGPANAPRPTSSSRPDVRQRPDRGSSGAGTRASPHQGARWSPRHEPIPSAARRGPRLRLPRSGHSGSPCPRSTEPRGVAGSPGLAAG